LITLVAVKPPSTVVAVIVAAPTTTPVTNPLGLTVAISLLDEFQVTLLFVAFAGNTVSVSCCVPPTLIEADVGLTLTDAAGTGATVIKLVAVKPPSCVVAVIDADPMETPVTNPSVFTVTIPLSDELQVTVLLEALTGNTVAVSCCVPATLIVAVVGLTDTDVAGTGVTVIALVVVKPPSCVVTVIVADPIETAVTRPVALTVATELFDELHVTILFVASAGCTSAESCCVPPTIIEAVEGLTPTEDTCTTELVNVTSLK
jgi:hypothetical protein